MSYIGTQPTPQSLESRQEFTATASQTTFATSGYTVGYVDVYLNGVKLSTSDFTATNGSDIVLGSGAAAGDVLAVVMKNDHSDLVALPITDSQGNNVLSESGSVVTLTADAAVIEGSSSGDLVRITQTGSGNALVVEDSANPDSTPFVVNSSGDIGIGTSSPGARLDVKGLARSSIGTGTGAGGAGYAFYQFGTSATASENWHIGAEGDGSFRFYNQAFGAGIERMRIDSSGNVLVGTTTSNGRITSTPMTGFDPFNAAGTWATSAAIGVSGFFGGGVSWIDGSAGYCAWVDDNGNDFNIAGGGTGAVAAGGLYINNYANTWSARSDERDKINLEPITDAVTKIKSLRTVIGEYSWQEGVRHPFLIAQDVQKVLPEAVSIANKSASQEEQRLGMSYTDMIPLLTAALQEAISKIEALTTRIEALETPAE